MVNRKSPKNKHWKFLRKTFQQLKLARSLAPPTGEGSGGNNAGSLSNPRGSWNSLSEHSSYGSLPLANYGVVAGDQIDNINQQIQQPQKPKSRQQQEPPPNLSPSTSPLRRGRRPSRVAPPPSSSTSNKNQGSSNSLLSGSSLHQEGDHEWLHSSGRSNGNHASRGILSVLPLATPAVSHNTATTHAKYSDFAVQGQRQLHQRRHIFLQQAAAEEDFICKALGMDNRFAMCIRHPNQPITDNTKGLLMGTALYRVKTCLICKSESQAQCQSGPDGQQGNSQHVAAMGNVIQEVQQMQSDKLEWEKRTKIMGASSSSGNWRVSNHSQRTSGSNIANAIDEKLPTIDILDNESGAASMSMLDLEISTHHATDEDVSKDTILSSTSSLHFTEDEWVEQVRHRVMQVRSWEDRFAIKNHSIFCRYFKMIKLGVPVEAVKASIAMDGYDSSIIDLDGNQSLKLQTNLLSPQALENLHAMGAFTDISFNDGKTMEETELSVPETVQRVVVSLRHRKLNQVFAASTLWDEVALRKAEMEEQNRSQVDLATERPESMQSIKSMPDRDLHLVAKADEPLSRSEGQLGRRTPKVRGIRREHARRTPKEQRKNWSLPHGTQKARLHGTQKARIVEGDKSEILPQPIIENQGISRAKMHSSVREDTERCSLRQLESTHGYGDRICLDEDRSGHGRKPNINKWDVNSGVQPVADVHKKLNGNSNRDTVVITTPWLQKPAERPIEQMSETETTEDASEPFSSETESPALCRDTDSKACSPMASGNEKVQKQIPTTNCKSLSEHQDASYIGFLVANERQSGDTKSAPAFVQNGSSEGPVASTKKMQFASQPMIETHKVEYDANPTVPERKASIVFEACTVPNMPVRRPNLRPMRPFDIVGAEPSNEPMNHLSSVSFSPQEYVRPTEMEQIAESAINEQSPLGLNNQNVVSETKGNGYHVGVAQKSERKNGMPYVTAPETPKKPSRTRITSGQESPPIKEVVLNDDVSLEHAKLQHELESLLRRTQVSNKPEEATGTMPLDEVVLSHKHKDDPTFGPTSVLTDDLGESFADTVRTEDVATFVDVTHDAMASTEGVSQRQGRIIKKEKTRNTAPLVASKSLHVSKRDVATQCTLESVTREGISTRQYQRLKAKLESSTASHVVKNKKILDLKRELGRRDKTIERLEQRVQSLEDRSKATGRVLESSTMQAKIDDAKQRQAALRAKFMNPNRLKLDATISASGLDFAALALSPGGRTRQKKHSRGHTTETTGDPSRERVGGAARSVRRNGSTASSRSLDSGLRTSVADWSSENGTGDTKQTVADAPTSKNLSNDDARAKMVILDLFDSWSAKHFTTVAPESPQSPTNRANRPGKSSPRRVKPIVEKKLSGPIERKEWDVGEEKEPLDIIR